MYQWWVFLHLAGVFALLASHGASVVLAFRLRTERDPQRVEGMLQMSGASIMAFYISLGVLLLGGVAAAFDGGLWGYGWIWASLFVLAVVMLAMYFMARPYYHRVRFVTAAITAGSTAVSDEQFDALLRSRRPFTIIGIGFGGLALILYLMLFKPTLGMAPQTGAAAQPAEADVTLVADDLAFSTDRLVVPADEGFVLALDNTSSVPHNVAIYDGEDALLKGDVFSGPEVVTYDVPPLSAGTYRFVCDVHPSQMSGVVEAS